MSHDSVVAGPAGPAGPRVDDWHPCSSVPHPEPVPGREVLGVCKQLASIEGGWRKWPRSLVDQLVCGHLMREQWEATLEHTAATLLAENNPVHAYCRLGCSLAASKESRGTAQQRTWRGALHSWPSSTSGWAPC